MTDNQDIEETLVFYRQKMSELPEDQQEHVKQIHAALTSLVKSTGKQGVIAAGLFSFEVLLEHFK